ncbi:MAG: hypothetical protein JKX73_07655, partial [Flavobacteriales bacterium]|nr:hypothetical protein [Flavobacteriales bacterium]
MRCLAVDGAGSVQVTWTPASDSCGVFFKYYIYFASNLGGTYNLIDSLSNWSNTTYNHVAANANVSSGFYYIEASSGCAYAISDTLETIFFSVGNTATGTANLQWNPLHIPAIPTNTDMYLIFREDTATGFLQLVDSVYQITAFADLYTNCDVDSIAYQIGIVDSSGCMSTSNIAMLEPDILPPPLVVIDSASVDPVTGQIIIGWSSTALDVEGYVISVYNTLNLGWDPVDTVFGTSSYTDLVGLLSITDSISVFAYDSCGRKGSFAAGHSVMQLSADLDTCAGEATLKWTP